MWQKKCQECSQAHSSGLFPQSKSLSPVATSAVATIPTILAAESGAAVLLSGVLSWCLDILKFSCFQSTQRILKWHHQAICCCCSYKSGGRNTDLSPYITSWLNCHRRCCQQSAPVETFTLQRFELIPPTLSDVAVAAPGWLCSDKLWPVCGQTIFSGKTGASSVLSK